MARTTINAEKGSVYFRTKIIRSKGRALSFAKALSANHTRFSLAECIRSTRTDGWYVQFLPKSQSRNADLYYTEYKKRQDKAEQEGQSYKWKKCLRPTGQGFYLCLSTTGKTYEVDDKSCTCEDHIYRSSAVLIPCKHRQALSMAIADEVLESIGIA